MIEFGNSLRAARETKGYSVRQLAELTRMAPSTVQELETENFSHIAAPIYGRGFVKLYCEAVGLDPKPYIEEFMEIFNGNRQTEIRERPHSTAQDASVQPAERPAADPLPSTPPPDQVQKPEPDLFQDFQAADPIQEQPLSRYAAPIRQTHSPIDLQAVIRLAVLSLGGLLVLALLAWGVRSVYRATTRSGENNTAAETVKSTPDKSNAARTLQKIPSLYID